MRIYFYDPATGIYTGDGVAQESPLEPGVFLIPANATTTAPPADADGIVAFIGSSWVVLPRPDAPPVDTEALRRNAYQAESDPLFFKAQRGEGTTQNWLDKVEEIKARYPNT